MDSHNVCCLSMKGTTAGKYLEEEREHGRQANHSHRETRNPFLRTPPSDASTTCPHQHHTTQPPRPAEETALFVSLDRDRLGFNPGLLSGHSPLKVVNVAVVLAPESHQSLGKGKITDPIRGPCHLGSCHLEVSHSCQDPMLTWPPISLLFVRSNIKCLIISLLCFCP